MGKLIFSCRFLSLYGKTLSLHAIIQNLHSTLLPMSYTAVYYGSKTVHLWGQIFKRALLPFRDGFSKVLKTQ